MDHAWTTLLSCYNWKRIHSLPMRLPLLFFAAAIGPLSASIYVHHDFDELRQGDLAGISSQFGAQTIAAMPGTGSNAMRMTPYTAVSFLPSYSQVVLAEPGHLIGSTGTFDLSFDFYLDDLQMRAGPGIIRSAEEFVVFFDTPTANRINFNRRGDTGEIQMRSGQTFLSSFSFNTVHRFRATADIPAGRLSAWLNGVQILNNEPLIRSSSMTSVRLSLSDDLTLPGIPSIYLDNITLSSIPEPGTAVLLCNGAVIFGTARRSRRQRP